MSTLRELAVRLLGAAGAGRREQDLTEELAFHREALEADLRRRGRSADEARREARLALGGPPQTVEAWREQRSLPFIDTLRQDVSYGVRMLRRTPAFTAAAILTLAIGIGANTAIFSVIHAVLLQPLPFANPGQLMTVGDRNLSGQASNVGFATLLDWRERSRSFDSFALMRMWTPTLVTDADAERIPAVRVSWNYFDLLGTRPMLGRGFTAEEDTPDGWRVVMLSEPLWRRRFGGDPQIVGRNIRMNDRDYRIVGVMPAGFVPLGEEHYYSGAEMWAPLGYALGGDSTCRSCQHLRAFGRLKPGVTVAQATAEMSAIREQMRREHPDDYAAGTIAVVPLQEALTGSTRGPLTILAAAVGFVLLIACANVASLLLARAQTRQRELAVRTALGAGRGRLIRQLLTESLLLSAAGGAGGILLAAFSVRALVGLAPVAMPRLAEARLDLPVLAFTAAVSIAAGLVFGLLPAWRGSAAAPQRAMALESRGALGGPGRARTTLVVADLAVALVLLAGAGLMLRTVGSLMRVDPGFDPSGLLTVAFSTIGQAYAEDEAVNLFQQRVLERIRALPGVSAAAIAGQVPFGGNGDCRGFHVKGLMKENDADDPCIERYGTTPEFLPVMKIPLRAGRFFESGDTASSLPVIVISDATRKLVWGSANPLGAEVRIGNAHRGPWYRVVGVVGDINHDDLSVPPEPAFYTAQAQFTDSYLVAVVKAANGEPLSLGSSVRSAIRSVDSTVPVYDIAAYPDLLAGAISQRRFVMELLVGFAAVALLLAGIGLYGVVSYSVSQRTREIGLRMAFGAKPAGVLRLVLSSGMVMVGAGVTAGLAAAVAVTRYLHTLIYGVSPLDPATLIAAAVLMTVVALAAHWVPARRALRIDPAVALRAD